MNSGFKPAVIGIGVVAAIALIIAAGLLLRKPDTPPAAAGESFTATTTAAAPTPTSSPPATTSSSAAPTTPAGTHLSGSVSLIDGNKYTSDLAFDVTAGSAATVDTLTAKPGEAIVTWTPQITGTGLVTNTTPGRLLPTAPGGMLYGFWPLDSPVCATHTALPGYPVGNGYGHFAGPVDMYTVHPVGENCGLVFGSVRSPVQDPIPVGGTRALTWLTASDGPNAFGATGTVAEADYPALVSALQAGPDHWIVQSGSQLATAPTSVTGTCLNFINGAPEQFWAWSPVPVEVSCKGGSDPTG